MNISPKKDIEASKEFNITCIVMQPLENKLEKGNKIGDATKVSSNGSLEITDINMPNIDSKVETNIVNAKEGYRIGEDGKKQKVTISKDRVELYEAILDEQEKEDVER